MKKVLCFLVVIFSIIGLCGCIKEDVIKIDQDKIDEVIYYIDDLPRNIKISDKDSVVYILGMYNELTDEEKKYVTNYEKLENAYNKIDALENESKYINGYLEDTCDILLSKIQTQIEKEKCNLDFVSNYEYKNEYVSYNFVVSYYTSNENVVTKSGKVYHEDKDIDVTITVNVKYNDYTFSKEKIVTVLKDSFKNLNQGQVIIAYCYEYTGIRENDLKIIDMVNYCFAQIKENDDGFYIDLSELSQIGKIKELHEYGIRVCLSIGGWQDDSSAWVPYQNASKTESSRKQVASAILDVIKRYELDGVDMDWEYPRSEDKNNFTLLMKEIRDTLKEENERYIVSAAVPSSLNTRRYDYVALNDILDYFNVMTYDMETSSNTSYQSALYTTSYSRYSTDDAVKSIINAGVDKRKVVLGMAFYGKKYEGVASDNDGRGQKYSSKREISFTEIYNSYLSKGIESKYDSSAGSNYLYDTENKIYICFEGEETIKAKCEYAISKDIGGVMWWSYENDKKGILMSYLDDMYNALKHKNIE